MNKMKKNITKWLIFASLMYNVSYVFYVVQYAGTLADYKSHLVPPYSLIMYFIAFFNAVLLIFIIYRIYRENENKNQKNITKYFAIISLTYNIIYLIYSSYYNIHLSGLDPSAKPPYSFVVYLLTLFNGLLLFFIAYRIYKKKL